MNIFIVPILISGVLSTVLSAVTWMFRRRESINRIFSFFTLALAIDSFAFFFWFQFGSIEQIHTWMRITFTIGFLVPTGLVLFFLAFTGYDKRLDEKVWGIKVRLFRNSFLIFLFIVTILSQFTELVVTIPAQPQNIWDMQWGAIGQFMFPLFAGIFLYMFSLVFKSYRSTANIPQKRFILLLASGTAIWISAGYIGALIFPLGGELWNGLSYTGTGLMAIFYFVAIVKYQSDKVYELNLNLEGKVEDRTRELNEKNRQLADTLLKLKQMQNQVIVQEKMATLGQLVAGLAHEINTPISAMRSMKNTKSKAFEKLSLTLEKNDAKNNGNDPEIRSLMEVISKSDQLIDQGTDRLHDIIQNLKNFVRLDEAEMKLADIHEGLDSVLGLIGTDRLKNIKVVRDYGEVPPFICHPRELNQVFLTLLKNALSAIDGAGEIIITTRLENEIALIAIADNGKGIDPSDLSTIFDPVFNTQQSVVRANLGLSVCYQIVQEHEGIIEVESGPGEGSVFTVKLPLKL